jgi:hypothetical protein
MEGRGQGQILTRKSRQALEPIPKTGFFCNRLQNPRTALFGTSILALEFFAQSRGEIIFELASTPKLGPIPRYLQRRASSCFHPQ